MLKHRVITAVGLLTIFLLCLFVLPSIYWIAFLTVVVLLAFNEWLRLAEIKTLKVKTGWFVFLMLTMFCLQQNLVPLDIVLFCSVLLWVVLITVTLSGSVQQVFFNQLSKLFIAVWLLASTWWLLNGLRVQENGAQWILFFLGVIWSADIGAYFVGKRFGKTKLAPKVSPGKTIEGMFGGLVAVSVLSVLAAANSLPSNIWLSVLILCLVTATVSVGGDLYESQLKRQAGMKDSSNILPGHGGILDRIDSVLAGLPFFITGLVLLKLIPGIA